MNPLPRLLAHADWGTDARKRQMATSFLEDGHYIVQAPEPVGDLPTFLVRLRERAGPRETILLGFDFPIGLPAAYAARARIDDFLEVLPLLGEGQWAEFYHVAETPEHISLHRPFYPARPGGTLQQHLIRGLGLHSRDDLLRRCEQKTEARPAASPLFWTLGAKQVGKAAISGWEDVLAPGVRNHGEKLAIWPFAGQLSDLIREKSIVIAETYPAEAYVHLGFPRGSKQKQADRRARGIEMLAWAAQRPVICQLDLVAAIRDGFGPSKDGEDPFDAVAGLLLMLDVVLGYRQDGAPDDEAVQRVEGWILGEVV